MKHCFILNPYAGKGGFINEWKEKIEKACRSAEISFEIYLTQAPGDAAHYVRRKAAEWPGETIRFYACGGDGTLCEAANGIMTSEQRDNLSLGLIPSGTGNDFVRNFTDSENFLNPEAQIKAEPVKVDLIRCNDMYAVNMINVGFDCEVVCKTADLKKKAWIPSKMAYIAGLMATLIRKPGVSVKEAPDAEERRYLLTTYANGGFCGGGFYSNPLARLNDGKIDVLRVNNVSRFQFLSMVGSYKKGAHLTPRFASILNVHKEEALDLYFENDTNISVDGEIFRVRELHLSIEREALSFLVPCGSLAWNGEKKSRKEPISVAEEA